MADDKPVRKPNEGSGYYLVLAGWVVALGVFLIMAPADWFGPSWAYFANHGQIIIPAGGFGMGLCLSLLGTLQLLALWCNAYLKLSFLFFLVGFVFWASGLLLGAEGILGHQGLIESPLMLFIGIHKIVASVNLHRQFR
jgi:hypothetical protein